MADRINTLFARLRARRVPADFTDMQTALAVLDVTSADGALRAWRRMQLQVRRPVDGGHLFHTAVETEYMAVACRYALDRAKEVAEHVRPRHLADGYDFAFVDGASFRDRLVVFVRGELADAKTPRHRARYQDALRRLGATTGMGRRTRSHTRGAGLDDRDAAAAAAAAAMGADAQRAADAAEGSTKHAHLPVAPALGAAEARRRQSVLVGHVAQRRRLGILGRRAEAAEEGDVVAALRGHRRIPTQTVLSIPIASFTPPRGDSGRCEFFSGDVGRRGRGFCCSVASSAGAGATLRLGAIAAVCRGGCPAAVAKAASDGTNSSVEESPQPCGR